MRLEDWMRLSGLTHLSLRRVQEVVMVPDGLPDLTTLRSLVEDLWFTDL